MTRSELLRTFTELFILHLTICDDLSNVDGSDDARALRCQAHHLQCSVTQVLQISKQIATLNLGQITIDEYFLKMYVAVLETRRTFRHINRDLAALDQPEVPFMSDSDTGRSSHTDDEPTHKDQQPSTLNK